MLIEPGRKNNLKYHLRSVPPTIAAVAAEHGLLTKTAVLRIEHYNYRAFGRREERENVKGKEGID